MQHVAEKSAPSALARWGNVLFWLGSGIVIGGLLPTAALWFVPEDRRPELLWLAAGASPLAAVIGGAIGAVIGACDRTPPFALKRGMPK
jgi:hypothetical protein